MFSFPLVFFVATCQYMDMVCIYCSGPTRVVNSRLQRRSNNIWRRRVCEVCKATFTTQEKPTLSTSFMVEDQTSRKLKPFTRDKLFLSIFTSCRHRSDALQDAIALTETVLAALDFPQHKSINTRQIAQTTHSILERFDTVAATLYKAYHLKAKATS